MLQQAKPEDFVIATGEQHSVRDFVDAGRAQSSASRCAGRARASTRRAMTQLGNCIVAVDPRYFRPAEVETLLGDATKARSKLGWHAARSASRSWSRKWCART